MASDLPPDSGERIDYETGEVLDEDEPGGTWEDYWPRQERSVSARSALMHRRQSRAFAFVMTA